LEYVVHSWFPIGAAIHTFEINEK